MQQLFSQTENVKEVLDYLNNPNINVCLLEGKAGYFKTHCINEALKTLGEKTADGLIFNIKCYESTTLDDLFLLFLDTIKNYAKKKKLAFSKIETTDIAERINHYLVNIKTPSIVIIDSLQNVFNNHNEKDKEEIIRFIIHLASLKNYKLILVANDYPQNFDNEFKSKFIPVKTIAMKPLTLEEINDYFSRQTKSVNDKDIEKFYQLSKGSPTSLLITSYLLTLLKTSLDALLSEYNTKHMTFGNYLIQKILTFVPENVKYSLEALAVFNGGLSENFLIQEELFTKDQIDYLLAKGLLVKEYGLIYVKSVIKNYLQKTVPNIVKNKFHLYWKEFYSSQLPLKPADRAVLISRNTMRAQIEYHTAKIVATKKQNIQTPNLSLVSYLNSDLTSWNYEKTNAKNKTDNNTQSSDNDKKERQLPEPPDSIKNKQKQTDRLEKYELTKQELAMLGLPVDITLKDTDEKKQTNLSRTTEQKEEIIEEESKPKESLADTFNLALSMEDVHNYETAATFYLQAMDMKEASDYSEYEPKLLEHLAYCCEKMNRTSDSMDFYNKLVDLYTQNNDTDNVNKTKLNIAGIYRKTYKLNHARVIYESFVKNTENKQLSDEVLVLSYVGLAEIDASSANLESALKHYSKAFSYSIEPKSTEIKDYLSQASFKYAMILDEYNETEKAFIYYEKCINLAEINSSSVSGSYTNMAEIQKYYGNKQKALEYYEKAIEIDTELSNYEGVYYVALQIAILYESSDKNQTLNWLLKSLSAAKRTNDTLYINNAYIELGDFYSNNNSCLKAVKAYLNAQKTVENAEDSFEKEDNLSKINRKLTKSKKQITNEEYENLVKEVMQNE